MGSCSFDGFDGAQCRLELAAEDAEGVLALLFGTGDGGGHADEDHHDDAYCDRGCEHQDGVEDRHEYEAADEHDGAVDKLHKGG